MDAQCSDLLDRDAIRRAIVALTGGDPSYARPLESKQKVSQP